MPVFYSAAARYGGAWEQGGLPLSNAFSSTNTGNTGAYQERSCLPPQSQPQTQTATAGETENSEVPWIPVPHLSARGPGVEGFRGHAGLREEDKPGYRGV